MRPTFAILSGRDICHAKSQRVESIYLPGSKYLKRCGLTTLDHLKIYVFPPLSCEASARVDFYINAISKVNARYSKALKVEILK
jgi:hypothetical protein